MELLIPLGHASQHEHCLVCPVSPPARAATSAQDRVATYRLHAAAPMTPRCTCSSGVRALTIGSIKPRFLALRKIWEIVIAL